MSMRVHHEADLEWRRIGDIQMGWMREHIDATELEGRLSFHEPGGEPGLQLMEMRLNPATLIAPHAHDHDEIFYIVEGSLHLGDRQLTAGGSLFVPAGMTYSFRTGKVPARLLNFRATADHSFHPAT